MRITSTRDVEPEALADIVAPQNGQVTAVKRPRHKDDVKAEDGQHVRCPACRFPLVLRHLQHAPGFYCACNRIREI